MSSKPPDPTDNTTRMPNTRSQLQQADRAKNAVKNKADLTSQAKAKDPDLIEFLESAEKELSYAELVVNHPWNLEEIVETINLNIHEEQSGNGIWAHWNQTQYAHQWGLDCHRYSERFADPPKEESWEQAAD